MPRRMITTVLAACAALALILGASQPAAAQYFYELPVAFETAPVGAGDALAVQSNSPLWRELASATGLELQGAFRVEAGMQRRFMLGYGGDETPRMDEERIIPLDPDYAPAPLDDIAYTFAGYELYIACGHTGAKGWDPLVVTCCMVGGGEVTELARHECGANYAIEIYAMDITHDGVVELVIPWMTGVGGGGGIDVFTVLMTGGFSGYGPELEPLSLYSYIGSMQLVDVNGDGSWEIQTWFPVLPSVMGYMFSELYAYDAADWDWVDGSHLYPWFVDDQLEFYEQLYGHVQRLAEDPDNYLQHAEWITYGCEIDGVLYSLDGFLDGGDEVDEYWLSELRDFLGRMGR